MTRKLLPALAIITVALSGCRREPPAPPPPRPPEVQVALPLVREVIDQEVFTGRTEASQRVDLRARVTGELKEVYFKDGDTVTKDKPLFLIDPDPFKADLAETKALLGQADATLKRAEADHARGSILYARQAISREEFDRLVADLAVARSAVGVAQAKVDKAALNLRYTEVKAPFDGRMSRRMIDPGNSVKADETVLSTLVAIDPMYAYFDVDERTLLRKLLKTGKSDFAPDAKRDIVVGLADEEGFPHKAVVNFFDNKLDPNTGSLWMRGQFTEVTRPLSPGMFIRVRFPLSKPYKAILVSEQALGSDQGNKFVYVVDAQNKVAVRPVKIGRMQDDGTRVILDGVKEGEQIVVSGLQRVRPNIEVAPKKVDMPLRGKK